MFYQDYQPTNNRFSSTTTSDGQVCLFGVEVSSRAAALNVNFYDVFSMFLTHLAVEFVR